MSPLENAIEVLENKNQQLKTLIAQCQARQMQNVNPLTMCLNGVIDAAVNGGVARYQEVRALRCGRCGFSGLQKSVLQNTHTREHAHAGPPRRTQAWAFAKWSRQSSLVAHTPTPFPGTHLCEGEGGCAHTPAGVTVGRVLFGKHLPAVISLSTGVHGHREV